MKSIEFEKGDKGGGLRRFQKAQRWRLRGKMDNIRRIQQTMTWHSHVDFETDTGTENREWVGNVFGDFREQVMLTVGDCRGLSKV